MPHLISATLTEEAYKVYCRWKDTRSASEDLLSNVRARTDPRTK